MGDEIAHLPIHTLNILHFRIDHREEVARFVQVVTDKLTITEIHVDDHARCLQLQLEDRVKLQMKLPVTKLSTYALCEELLEDPSELIDFLLTLQNPPELQVDRLFLQASGTSSGLGSRVR